MSKRKPGRGLPIPNVKMRMTDEEGDFTPEEVLGMICNPIYAGVGNYPQLIPDDEWVAAASQAIKRGGTVFGEYAVFA